MSKFADTRIPSAVATALAFVQPVVQFVRL